jgi:uncharacterized integral membrane protein
MIRRALAIIILVPLGALIVALAVANRQTVPVSFDPFGANDSAFIAHLPLFVLMFATVIAGVLIGGIAAWLKQSKWRRRARRLGHELRRTRDEIRDMKRRAAESAAPAGVVAERSAERRAAGSGFPGEGNRQTGAIVQRLPPPRVLPPAA